MSDELESLIGRSSFGTIDAKDLRARTPRVTAEVIAARVNPPIRSRQVRVVSDWAVAALTEVAPVTGRMAMAATTPRGDRYGRVADTVRTIHLPGRTHTSDWPVTSLLGRLRETTRRELLNIGTVVRYAADREVIEQDAKDTHALLLLDGVVKVQTIDEAGDTALLAIRSAGDLVGEMAALDRKPRSATVVTCGEVTAKLISSTELMSFLYRRNDVFVELITLTNDRLRWANQRRRDLLSHPASQRVARVLAELVRIYGREEAVGWTLGIPLTKVELASIAGMKPRTAEKAFSDLRKAGVVVSHLRRDVLVPDLDALRAFAEA
ncbi:Crp/Fnr family transcriptional regulator [Actinosynnema sp. NPDC020468]|uniref:Crp/Fnr family transcriptional regulator n=1 Tax=Actinosynnema sp. NPDC020468 TaxID=3154488 RepID=UPI0033D20102